MATLSIEGLQGLLGQLDIDGTPITRYTGADVLTRPADILRSLVAEPVAELTGCDRDVAFEALQSPAAMDIGDLALAVPRLKLPGANAQLASDVATRFPRSSLYWQPFADGIHLRIIAAHAPIPKLLLPYIRDRGEQYGINPQLGKSSHPGRPLDRKHIIVEFSRPNVAREFHGGNLHSTIIGACLANLYEQSGWKVTRLNYIGDWGKEVALLAVGWNRYGSEAEFERDAVSHLLDVYTNIKADFQPELDASHQARDAGNDTAEIESQGIFSERNAFFKRMEENDTDACALWKRFTEVFKDDYIQSYRRMGITFDEFTGESDVSCSDSVAEAEAALRDNGVYEEVDGAWGIDFKKHGAKSLGYAVVRNRTGTTTYLLREIAGVLDRDKKYNFDKMFFVLSDHDTHFPQVIKALELMGKPELAVKLQHVAVGKVKGLQTELENPHLLSTILDRCTAIVAADMETEQNGDAPLSTAEHVAINSLVVQDMHNKRANGYTFDRTKLTDFEGETGPHLVFAYSRLVLALQELGATQDDMQSADYSLLEEDSYIDLLRLMFQFPEVVASTYKSLEPSQVLNYLFRLVKHITTCLDEDEEPDEDDPEGEPQASPELKIARAALYDGARQIVANGMRLLGIKPGLT